MKPALAAATPEYIDLFASLVIVRLPEVDRIIGRILASQGRYSQVEARTGVPWYVIALLHNLECSLNFGQHLHNGDSIYRSTINVPANRPPGWDGTGPWEDSAVDALQYDRLDEVTVWDVPRICYEVEQFNGWGYRSHGIHSPYLWAGSQHYTAGKFVADHVFSATAVSDQIGAIVLLHRMCAEGIVALKACGACYAARALFSSA